MMHDKWINPMGSPVGPGPIFRAVVLAHAAWCIFWQQQHSFKVLGSISGTTAKSSFTMAHDLLDCRRAQLYIKGALLHSSRALLVGRGSICANSALVELPIYDSTLVWS